MDQRTVSTVALNDSWRSMCRTQVRDVFLAFTYYWGCDDIRLLAKTRFVWSFVLKMYARHVCNAVRVHFNFIWSGSIRRSFGLVDRVTPRNVIHVMNQTSPIWHHHQPGDDILFGVLWCKDIHIIYVYDINLKRQILKLKSFKILWI